MNIFTVRVLKYCKILVSAKMNLIATFIADRSNVIEIVQPVKITLKCWSQLDGGKLKNY